MPKHLTIWTQALILALGACPLPAALLAAILTSAAGCHLGETAPVPCVVLGHDFGQLLYEMATSIRFVGLTIPLAILALIVWRIVLHFTSRQTEPTSDRRQVKIKDSKDTILKFPGPVTIGPPLKGRMMWLFGAALLTILFANVDTTTIPITVFFGIVTMIMVAKLLPGSCTLRLDASGFETTRWFLHATIPVERCQRVRGAGLQQSGLCDLQRQQAAPRIFWQVERRGFGRQKQRAAEFLRGARLSGAAHELLAEISVACDQTDWSKGSYRAGGSRSLAKDVRAPRNKHQGSAKTTAGPSLIAFALSDLR